MKPNLFRSFLIFLVLFPFLPGNLWGQASVNVSLTDPVYRDIDKLVAHGLVDVIVSGQKPYSRREIARITAEAMKNFSRITGPLEDPSTSEKKKAKLRSRKEYVERILSRLEAAYREELIQWGVLPGKKKTFSVRPIAMAQGEVTLADSPAENLPVENGLGQINAQINPLVNYRQGRHLVDGATLSLETSHWLRYSDHFALYLQPRFQIGIGRDGSPDENRVDILNLYGKFWVKNFEIQLGRDNLFYGQGKDTGFILSNNPRGLDMGKISNDSPFFFPWVFRYMGANKLSFFYADLGPEQNFPHAYLAGYKWSLEPLRFFEVGASVVVQSGGEGSPPASFGQRVADQFPFGTTAHIETSNKFAGLDGRFRIRPLRGAELYFEMIWDDTPGFNSRSLWQDTGYLFGLYLPRVDNSGKIDFRFEYHHTGVRYYRHGQFTSGWTLNQFILGDNLGPDAWGLYGSVNWDVDAYNRLTFNGAFESRSSDIWAAQGFVDEDGEFHITGDFQKVQDNPDEMRYRAMTEWFYRFPKDLFYLTCELGYERVINFGFVEGQDRNNFLGRVAFQFNFDRWGKLPEGK